MLQVAYHGGRMVTYALVGACCGLLGAALDLSGSLVGVKNAAAILAGGMMIAVGVVAGLRHSGLRLPAIPVPAVLTRWIVIGQRAAVGLRPLPRALTIGLLSAFLPCGWLYMFAMVAAGSGSAVWGAAIMTAFWLGTVPILASLGVGVQALTGTFGKRIPLITAMLVVCLGMYTIIDRWAIPAQAFESALPSGVSADPIRQVEEIQDSAPPCCRDHAVSGDDSSID
jgi:sulfite exporter TauE/SafE